MHEASSRPIAAFALSMVIFGTIGIFRRMIPLPSEVLACARGAMGSVFLYLLLRVKGKRFDFAGTRKRMLLLILTGVLIGLNWILLFEAYNYTSVAVATLAYYMQPVFVIIASVLLLKEKITARRGVCALVSVAGMVLVSGILDGFSGEEGSPRGVLLGLGAAALYASVVLLNKKVTGVPIYEKTIVQLASAAVVMIPYMLLSGSLHAYELNTVQALCLIAVGIIHTGIAYAVYFGAIEKLPAQTSAILSYIDPVTAVLLSALLLKEPLSGAGVAGAVMILVSAIISEK